MAISKKAINVVLLFAITLMPFSALADLPPLPNVGNYNSSTLIDLLLRDTLDENGNVVKGFRSELDNLIKKGAPQEEIDRLKDWVKQAENRIKEIECDPAEAAKRKDFWEKHSQRVADNRRSGADRRVPPEKGRREAARRAADIEAARREAEARRIVEEFEAREKFAKELEESLREAQARRSAARAGGEGATQTGELAQKAADDATRTGEFGRRATDKPGTKLGEVLDEAVKAGKPGAPAVGEVVSGAEKKAAEAIEAGAKTAAKGVVKGGVRAVLGTAFLTAGIASDVYAAAEIGLMIYEHQTTVKGIKGQQLSESGQAILNKLKEMENKGEAILAGEEQLAALKDEQAKVGAELAAAKEKTDSAPANTIEKTKASLAEAEVERRKEGIDKQIEQLEKDLANLRKTLEQDAKRLKELLDAHNKIKKELFPESAPLQVPEPKALDIILPTEALQTSIAGEANTFQITAADTRWLLTQDGKKCPPLPSVGLALTLDQNRQLTLSSLWDTTFAVIDDRVYGVGEPIPANIWSRAEYLVFLIFDPTLQFLLTEVDPDAYVVADIATAESVQEVVPTALKENYKKYRVALRTNLPLRDVRVRVITPRFFEEIEIGNVRSGESFLVSFAATPDSKPSIVVMYKTAKEGRFGFYIRENLTLPKPTLPRPTARPVPLLPAAPIRPTPTLTTPFIPTIPTPPRIIPTTPSPTF